MLSRNWWGYCSSGKLPSEVDWSLKYSMMWLNYLKHCLTVVARPPLPAADAPWRPPAAFVWPCCVLQSPWFSYCRLPPCPAWWRPPGWPSPRRTRCSRRHPAFRGLSSLSIWRRLRWEWKGNGYEPGKKFEYQNVWKLLKMSYLNFRILAFSTNFCPIISDLFGNTVWPQTSGFQKLTKLTIFGISYELLSTQNVNVARFARNVEWDFFCDFQTRFRVLLY